MYSVRVPAGFPVQYSCNGLNSTQSNFCDADAWHTYWV